MKIIYLHQYFKTNEENGGTRSYEFAKRLVSEGHEVIMITGELVKVDNLEGIKIISTKSKIQNNMGYIQRIKSFADYIVKSIYYGLKIKNVDLIFVTSTPLTIAIPGIILKKIKKAKFVFEVRDVWPDAPIELGFIKNSFIKKFLILLEKRSYIEANHIIALSEGMKNNILRKGVIASKVSVITNMCNLELYNSININSNVVKKEYGLENKFICIHPGTMGFVNGLEYVLKLAEITKEEEDIVYLLIGEGKEKDKLIQLKEEKNLKNVIIRDGLPKKDIIKLIKASDIGIMCVSNYKILEDNSANKFFDFLAAKLPVFINYKGWQSEVLANNNAGFSFEYDDLQTVTDTLININKDKKLHRVISENSGELASEFSVESSFDKLNNIIKKI